MGDINLEHGKSVTPPKPLRVLQYQALGLTGSGLRTSSSGCGLGRWLTLGKFCTLADASCPSVTAGVDVVASVPSSFAFSLALSPKIESASSLIEDAVLAPAFSAARRSFSKRTSLPRL